MKFRPFVALLWLTLKAEEPMSTGDYVGLIVAGCALLFVGLAPDSKPSLAASFMDSAAISVGIGVIATTIIVAVRRKN